MEIVSPLSSITAAPRKVGNKRHEVAVIASNTGSTSVGDSLMTRRMSAVAVWRSSASLVSRNRRAFCIAITAWSAKVLISAISFSLNGLIGKRATPNAPMPLPFQINGTYNCEWSPIHAVASRMPGGTSFPFMTSG